MVRHALATLAYRGGKAVRGAPAEFAEYRPDPGSRTPGEILAHVGDLFDWALTLCAGQQAWQNSPALPWDQGTARFFRRAGGSDARVASGEPLAETPERLFQGPIADALTHVGQIAMLRRMSGAAMKGENYHVAEIVVGRVGPHQAAPRREFQ